MATTIFNTWLFEALAAIDPEDYSPAPVNVSLFVRAPHLEDDTTSSGWAATESADELFASSHWQVPGKFVDGDYVPGNIAGTSALTLVPAGEDGYFLAELFEDFVIDGSYASTAQPVIAMAFWIAGVLGEPPVENPLICMIRLDSPILVMADSDHPATISTAALFGAYRS